jgi:D-3-phosphoglycerate dehydrogenase
VLHAVKQPLGSFALTATAPPDVANGNSHRTPELMKTVFVDCTPELKAVMNSRNLEVPASITIHHGPPAEAALESLCRDAEILLIEHTTIPPAILQQCGHLRAIVFMGTGASTYIPMDDAAALGIKVITTPGYGNRAVAEHALALLLAAAREVVRMDRDLRNGLWVSRGGQQLEGRKIAVIGLGEIGRTFADMAVALRMEVAGWNRTPMELPYFVRDLDAALTNADFVSLHLALNPATRALIDGPRLSRLKRGAILVNTARAQLVDTRALHTALKSGQLRHAALDVFVDEPLVKGHEWADLDNVTLTAHAAYMTDDAYAELWRRAMAALQELQ